ncbi:MAG TPA: TIM-barrel domain-containing protein, partial [Planctomycetota bacterium]|nr:TIM-barrel domain-containing protein [Planctomycetota bacterium]
MIRPGSIESFSLDGSRVTFDCERGVLCLTAYRADVVHVAFFPGDPVALEMWGIEATPEAAPVETEMTADAVHVSTGVLTVGVDRASAQLTFTDAASGVLLRSTDVALEPATVSDEGTHHLHLTFDAPDDESYYGLGQHQDGRLDHRGKEVLLWHDYEAEGGEIVAVPFMVTVRQAGSGYGFVLDNPSRAKVTPGVDGKTTWWAEVADAASFFVIAGASADAIYDAYRFLTGASPLPPLAAVGYIQCKQRYESRDELMRVARTYREKGYPCDVLVVDWFHWKTLGDLDLDETFWPDAAGMNRELAAMGYHMMISCWPRFMKESTHYDTLEAHGWFMKQSDGTTLYGTPADERGALIDTTNPEAAAWYWNTLRDSYAAKGFTSWWLDEDEPDVCPHAYFLHAGTGARVHNVYPLTHTRAVYEGHRRDLSERCLILSRSAYHGAQKNGTTFWSSDIHPTWDVLRRQVPTGLNFCASGFAWWSSDIGGWQALPDALAADESYKELLIGTGDVPKVVGTRLDYPELYVRWFQFGVFCPTFRAHGTRPANEVWSYGEEAERVLVKYLELRYRLLPYLYSLAWRTHVTGAPFMRALFMDFPDDARVRDVADEYMFGPAFLVAPVVTQGR